MLVLVTSNICNMVDLPNICHIFHIFSHIHISSTYRMFKLFDIFICSLFPLNFTNEKQRPPEGTCFVAKHIYVDAWCD